MITQIHNRSPQLLQLLIILLFIFAPFFYQPNNGGDGFDLPFNITVWAAAITLICTALLVIVQRGQISLPINYLAFLAIPAVIIGVGIVTGAALPIDWLFRQLYVAAGVLFLFALFQFIPRRTSVDHILFLVAISMLPHATIGMFQLFLPGSLAPWLATATYPLPIGVFQQINVQASFLATGLAITLYLVSRPLARQLSLLSKTLLTVTAGCSALIIASSGSRVGLISAITAILLILVSRLHQLSFHKKLSTAIVLAVLLGGAGSLWVESSGINSALKKTAALTEGNHASARLGMYSIAYDLIKQKPLTGHGIGNFLNVWTEETGRFHEANPKATLPPYITHPHNELILWLIEGGLIAAASIILAALLTFVAVIRCGWQRGAAYFAMLFPITFHTQVELPLFISSVHYFLWLLLIFMVLRHSSRVFRVNLSQAAKKLAITITILLLLGIHYFLINSARAQIDIMNFVQPNRTTPSNLQIALSNLYFKPYAEELAMRSNLYHSIASKNSSQVDLIVGWTENQLKINPKLKLFEDLIAAYEYRQDQGKKCKVIANGHYRYPLNQPLMSLDRICKQQLK